MRIREAEPADIDAITAIGHRTWPETYGFAGAEYVADGLARWWSTEAIVQSMRDTTMLVAAAGDGGLLGVGNIDLRGQIPIIHKLYVVPRSQGTGAGSALLAALLDRAPGRPVRLGYADGNEPAAGFYARRGFTELSREPSDRPGEPDIVWLERRPT